MPDCVNCSCSRPAPPACTGRVLVRTQVRHTMGALRASARGLAREVREPSPGLLDVVTDDPRALLAALGRTLSPVEADEVRVADVGGLDETSLLSAALAAPTLAQAAARVHHADLLGLLDDERGNFRAVYQPIVDLTSPSMARVIGYEALLRAGSRERQVGAAELFGAATEAGWLHVLDRVGRTTALRDAAGWLGDALLFVNFLPTTIYRPEVCLRTTEQAADAAGIDLGRVVFEVTESERVTDLDHLKSVFAYYRRQGCLVALDDLGAGYSSLDLLVRLEPDVVKLDRDIVQRLPGAASSAVVRAVTDIVHAYGGQVLAECVETPEQAEAAAGLGVDLGQGWHFGRPDDPPAPTLPAARSATAAETTVAPSAATVSPPAAGRSVVRVAGNDPAVALPDAGGTGLDDPSMSALLARALDACSAGATIADATALDFPLIYVNRAFEGLTGYGRDELLGRNCRFMQGPREPDDAAWDVREALREGRTFTAVLRNFRKDGTPWWNELHLSPVTDPAGRVTHYLGFQQDVTARVEAEREARHLAEHDELTGLPNRRHLMQALAEALADPAPERSGALLFIDLDGFKAINDRLGHGGGDIALAAAALCLRRSLRAGDLLSRYSGDEFVALLGDVPGESAVRVAERAAAALLESLTQPLLVGEEPVQLGASIGVALFPRHGRTADDLLQAADQAMYRAKHAGRGQVRLAGA